jgi:ribose transport system permease protein
MPSPAPPHPAPPAWWQRWEARDLAPLITLLALAGFFAIASPSFLKPATAVQILKQGSHLGIVAVGLTFVLLCAEIDLSVGFVALWTACLCGWLFENYVVSPELIGLQRSAMIALCILVPLLTSLVLGLISGSLTVWSRLPSFIITLAMMNIALGMARYLTQSETLDVPPLLKTIGNNGWRLSTYWQIPYSAMLATVVFLLGHVVLEHTRFGRYVYMTGGNREAARLAGVRTGRIVIACLAISAVTAGIGGLVNAGRLNSISLDQNADLLLQAVACVVLGGTSLFGGEGSMGKTLVGVVTFTMLNLGLTQIRWIDDLARQWLMGVVLMTALVINGVLARRR